MNIRRITVAGMIMLAATVAFAAGTNVTDVLDENDGWTELSAATFVASSGSLSPTAGTNFMYHWVGANWSGSAVCKDLGFVIQEGFYVITLNAGHDGDTNRPFADVDGGRVVIGFLDSSSTLGTHADVKNNISAFTSLTGVTKKSVAEPVPNDGWETWQYTYKVEAGSPAIGTSVFFGIQAQSSNLGGVQAAFDNVSITFYPNGFSGAAGELVSGSVEGFKAVGVQAEALGAWMGYTANQEISIVGTMARKGGPGDNPLNDKIGFAFGSATSDAWFDTSGKLDSTNYALFATTTTDYPGSNERYSVYKAGSGEMNALAENAAATNNTIDFVINLTLPANYDDDVDGLGHVYDYEFGLDYDRDGLFEVINSGTFDIWEDDRVRFGFILTKSPTSVEMEFTNSYVYAVVSGYTEITPLVTEIGNISIEMIGSDAVISWSGTNGVTFALQKKLDLQAGSWSNIVQGLSGTGKLSITNSAVDEPAAYYRVTTE